MEHVATRKVILGAALASCAALLVSGCAAARRPVSEMVLAEHAVRRAEVDADVRLYAPGELRSAQDNLALARRADRYRDYDEARRLAEVARLEAQLAEAKADAWVAGGTGAVVREDVEVVRESAPGAATVVERTTTTTAPASSSVVVERRVPTTSTVVIERPARSDLIIERTAEPEVLLVPE
jgi:hypothetical protein